MDLWGGSQGTSVHVQLDLLQSHSILAVFFGCELPSLEMFHQMWSHRSTGPELIPRGA